MKERKKEEAGMYMRDRERQTDRSKGFVAVQKSEREKEEQGEQQRIAGKRRSTGEVEEFERKRR